MNKTVTDEDGFSFVSYKKKRPKNMKQVIPVKPNTFITKDTPDTRSKNFSAIIKNIQDELKHSDFMCRFREDLHCVLTEWDLGSIITALDSCDTNVSSDISSDSSAVSKELEAIDIVCYGLGQFSSCTIARYQLGFLLVLKKILQSAHVYVYDPQFSIEEIDVLKELGLTVLNVNEEAKRILIRKSVCFMPHCDLPLYNNLLWANWNCKRLAEVAIIGNSFQTYELKKTKRRLEKKAKYVHLACKFVTEIRMANIFHFTDIFNDLSIHYFKSDSLSTVDSPVWADLEEPLYTDDEEIIKSV